MSVLHDGGYGGVQAVNQMILSALADNGEEAGVIVLLDRSGSNVEGMIPELGAGGSRLRFLWLTIRNMSFARNSITLVTHLGLAPIARLVKLFTGSEIILIVHGAEATHPLSGLRKWGLAKVDLIVAVSHHTLAAVLKHNPYIVSPATVCHLPARILPHTVSYQLPLDAIPHVLIVGRLWGRGLEKGQDRLIKLWPSVRSEVPDAELVIVGEGAGRASLEELADRMGVKDSVSFLGDVDDEELASLYQSCDIFALPSEGEGFGLVLAEAMQFGLPCIASSRDAGAEVIEHERTGIVVDPYDTSALRTALVRLLTDDELRTTYGLAGQERVNRKFSPEAFRRRLLEILGS